MLAIKLRREGKRNQPHFRLIVLEKTRDPWGDFLEDLGWLNPRTKEKGLKIGRIKYWLSRGAQPTPSVHNLLVNASIIPGPKKKVTKTKKEKAEKK